MVLCEGINNNIFVTPTVPTNSIFGNGYEVIGTEFVSFVSPLRR